MLKLNKLHETALGRAYAGSTVNASVFRCDGCLTVGDRTFASYYESPTVLVVCILFEDRIESVRLHGSYKVGDAHNTISMGVDYKGCIHIAYAHHVSALRYRRTLAPLDISRWTEEIPMTGAHETHVTYPNFVYSTTQKCLYFLYREGDWKAGSIRVKRYCAKGVWVDNLSPVLSGISCSGRASSPYINTPCIDASGRIHIAFTWRSSSTVDPALVCNSNLGYVRSDETGNNWETSKGVRLIAPIEPAAFEVAWPIAPGENLMNQCGMALASNDTPVIAYYANDETGVIQIYLVWLHNGVWYREVMTTRSSAFNLYGGGTLELPISRPVVFTASEGLVYVLYRDEGSSDSLRVVFAQIDGAQMQRLGDANTDIGALGYYEPIINHSLWRARRRLMLYTQYCEQSGRDTLTLNATAPALLVEFFLMWHAE